jgi:tetratricopeptide (TPR) repeat protein
VRRAARFAGAAAIAVAAVWMVVHFCYRPYVCNVRKSEARRTLERLYAHADAAGARIVARRTVETMDHCIAANPADVGQSMIRAGALRMLGRPEEAAVEYRRALHYDRRSELYFNLGLAEIESGDEEKGLRHLVLASLTSPTYLPALSGVTQDKVGAIVNRTIADVRDRRMSKEALRDLSHSLATAEH